LIFSDCRGFYKLAGRIDFPLLVSHGGKQPPFPP
jgi:hypothetical protein